MTRNQIAALQLQEEKRANAEKEKIAKWELPAKYLSGIGALLKGVKGSHGHNDRGPSKRMIGSHYVV